MTRNPILPTLTLAAMALAALVAGGCNTKKQPGAAKVADPGKTLRVALLPKKKGEPYFTSCAQGAAEAAKELGIELIYDGPVDGSAVKAAEMIQTWTSQGVDVIAVSPNDPEVLGPAMKKAREKGVRVITWDADGLPDAREFMVLQATSKEIGYALVDTMVKDLGGKDKAEGDAAIVTASLTAANQNEWISFMKERLVEYPSLKLVEIKPNNEDQQVATQITRDLIDAYPKLRAIWGISSNAFPGVADGIEKAGKTGAVMVTGLSTPNNMKERVHKGVVPSVILWNTVELGYLTIYAASAVARGELKDGSTTLKAGRLGEKKVVGDKVMLGNILVFTKDNIDNFDF